MDNIADCVLYQGRMVPREHFRVFVYGANNQKRLASSWEEYEELVKTGLWFDSLDAVPEVPESVTKREPSANKGNNGKKGK